MGATDPQSPQNTMFQTVVSLEANREETARLVTLANLEANPYEKHDVNILICFPIIIFKHVL